MILKCVVIDDEAIARSLLADYISKIPELELIATCSTALEAMPYVRIGQIDLLFLDIEMPEITGIDFLKSLGPGPEVILTTAYSEYAIQSYEYGVTDYLLKPIEFDRFYRSVNRLLAKANIQTALSVIQSVAVEAEMIDDFLFIKADNKVLKVNYAEIQYITSKGAYVQIVTTTGKKIMTLQSMNKMEEVLPPQTFFRVHRSHIVNISFINAIEGNTLRLSDNMMISLSKSKKDDFIQRIDRANLLK
ncbi:LytTR family DNA-binding domain-containing protein [Roseivirga sp. E12]|uniref:LytR/AlgR family response regulator transcription factor n=1 Tax=Roseivirga sp. E12 TaxID=2819237 RepID=UPI001ABD12AA|nr:LytTR family DNA-binding domain-containing protein [Roseivirga sp. E12]MBO3697822.1 response regulator transcription factor [Roseivirga sp. E12]